MRDKRSFLAVGAAAAAVVLVALLATPTERSVVRAATIVQDLREAKHRGLRIVFDHMGDKGVVVSGHLVATMTEPFSLAQAVEDDAFDPEPAEVFLTARVEMNDDAEHVPGLRMDALLGFSPEQKWLYARVDDLTPLVQEAGTPVALLLGGLETGMLFELDGILDDESSHDANEHRVQVRRETHHERVAVSAPQPAEPAGPALSVESGGDDPQFDAALAGFLSGRATPAELSTIITQLEDAAEEVTIVEVASGLHVLRAENFARSAAPDAEHEDWLPAMTLEIGYRAGSGVEWLEVVNVGPARGSARLEFIDALMPEDRLDPEVFRQDGVTQVVDLAALAESFGMLERTEQIGAP